jgi:vacuolar-type H+-ATPase subunit I/STV1
MSETKIIRNDRGLDFRRIEQFIKMFQQKCQNKSSAIDKRKKGMEEKRKAEAFEHFGLSAEIEAIEAIETKIEGLKTLQKVHEEKVRDYTQGKKERYNSYDSIRENSPIQNFINEGAESTRKKRDEVWALNQKLSNELWFARDLEQAIEIMQKFQEMLDAISLEEAET